MSDSNSPPSPESSSKNSPPSEESNTSPPSEGSSTSPPSEGSSSSPPSESSSSSPPSEASSSSPPSPDTGSSSSSSTGASSPPPPTDSSSSPPSIESNSPPPSTGSGSSPPSTGSSSSPPSTGSSSSPPSSGSSPSPPSNESSSSPPSSGSSSPPPATESVTSPPLTYPSPSSNSGSTPSSPFHSPQSAPPPPSSSGPDSPSQGKPSDEGSPPALSKSESPPSPDNPSTLDGPPSLSISSPPSIPKVGESSPADNEKSPSKPSESRSSGDSPMAHSDFLSSRNSSHLIPPSIIPSKDSSNNGGTSVGASVSLILAGIAITLIAIFIVIARRKKKKRMNTFIGHYRQSPNFSLKPDNYYNTNENPMGSFSFSGPHYGAPTRLSNASLSMYGSQRGQGYYSGPDPSGSKSCFSYEELMEITNGFSRENIIGEGGFGSVYKGVLPDGKYVAVKQLKAGSGQGEREFRAEVEIISRVHHRHLVSLVGYGIYDAQRLLVYEFVSNNTLEHHLHGNGLIVMEWSKRQKIAIGSAKGLAYLHEDCHPRIIHRDIKSANILIDDDWEAQVADFGLAKLSNDTHTHVSTRVMGTFGYLAPEYASSGKLTDRSDVYSFGVVLLELITGRKPVDASQPLGDESLVEWVVRALDCEGDMSDLSNGMKFGQSQVFDSSQYSSDIQRFRRMALGTEEFSSEYGNSGEFDRRSSMHSGEYRTRERSGEFSGESETRAMFSRPGQRSEVGSYRYGSRGFP